MSANVEAMVRAGIEAYRGGKPGEARRLLEKAIELDDYNEQAWMWLSAVVETEEEKRTCLENVLVINPENEEAQRGLKMLGVDSGGTAVAADTSSQADAANPFTDTGLADFGDVDFTDTSEDDDDWETIPPTATSSASSTFTPPETSAGEYDDWVTNLGLGNSGQDTAQDMTQQSATSSNAFDMDDVDDMFGLSDVDDDFGGNDPFGSEAQFDSFDDVGGDDSFTSGPFGGDDTFDDFDDIDDPAPKQTTAPQSSVVSPGIETSDDDSFFDQLDDADFAGGDFIVGDEAFEDNGSDLTPDELFGFIPDEIKATRLPGTRKGVGVGSIVMLLLLVLLNAGAVVFVIGSIS